ncbi:MAG: BCD family MFS transporter [Caldilineaceae bacterium]
MNWKKVIQLTMVHVGVSMSVVPITSTLNRIMIADLHFSALLVGFLISLPYLLSPLQVLIGNWADRTPIWGRYRSPWMVLGGLMATFGSYMTPHAVFLLQEQWALGLIACLGAFVVWGMGVNIASVSYLSLVSELSPEQSNWRSRAVSFMWTTMILATIITALLLGRLLETYTPATLYTAFGAIWLIASILILFGAANVEPPPTAARISRHQANQPLAALHLLTTNQSARRFFVYLLLVLISIHAQDVLLEPFGAEALQMPVAQTSRLTSIWGTGVFLTLTGGVLLVRRFGKKKVANGGAVLAALGFTAIAFAGLGGAINGFMAAVFVLGLGGGLMTVSNLSFMLDMTIPEAAGLYMGAWGVANFAGQALGNIVSGLLRDVIYQVTGNVLIGYVSVFGMEVVGLLIAVQLFRTISVAEFRRDAAIRIQDVLTLAIDS